MELGGNVRSGAGRKYVKWGWVEMLEVELEGSM